VAEALNGQAQFHRIAGLQVDPDFARSLLGLRCLLKQAIFSSMSAAEIIEQFKGLPAEERAQVAKYVVEHDVSWLPESFEQGMADAGAGRLADAPMVGVVADTWEKLGPAPEIDYAKL
jgi:hypothetical protein